MAGDVPLIPMLRANGTSSYRRALHFLPVRNTPSPVLFTSPCALRLVSKTLVPRVQIPSCCDWGEVRFLLDDGGGPVSSRGLQADRLDRRAAHGELVVGTVLDHLPGLVDESSYWQVERHFLVFFWNCNQP